MRMHCKIIEDLLPLYLDDVCSDESKKVVEEHLQECENCRRLISNMQKLQIPQIELDKPASDRVVKKGFKKIRKRWIASIIAMLMMIPISGIGILGYHEASGEGVAFSNLDDIYRCYKYLHYIENGKFEEASEMVDFSQHAYQLVESVAHMTLEEYQVYMKERFIKKVQEYEALGIAIENIRYDSAYRVDETGDWIIGVSFDEKYPDGSKQKIISDIDGETMNAGAYSYPHKGKTERDDYIDIILCLYCEEEASWYGDFEVAFELKEGEKAVIHRTENSDIEIDGVFNITYGTGAALIDEPYFQDTFETSVPGKYAVASYANNGEMMFLSADDLEIEIVSYNE